MNYKCLSNVSEAMTRSGVQHIVVSGTLVPPLREWKKSGDKTGEALSYVWRLDPKRTGNLETVYINETVENGYKGMGRFAILLYFRGGNAYSVVTKKGNTLPSRVANKEFVSDVEYESAEAAHKALVEFANGKLADYFNR